MVQLGWMMFWLGSRRGWSFEDLGLFGVLSARSECDFAVVIGGMVLATAVEPGIVAIVGLKFPAEKRCWNLPEA